MGEVEAPPISAGFCAEQCAPRQRSGERARPERWSRCLAETNFLNPSFHE
jgi:hypothetical protein